MAKRKSSDKTASEIRDALPFFKKGRGKISASWWNVSPSGDYATDIATGAEYAKAFMPLLTYNAGAATLGAIVSAMALAGRDKSRTAAWRGIDDVALGFLLAIGGILQSTIGGIALATVALETPSSDLGEKFVEFVKGGGAFQPLHRSTLFHDPNANIFDAAA